MSVSEDIITEFKDSKTLPHVALKVTQMVNDDNSTMQDFEEVIQLDPLLVTRLLRLVNSPYFGIIGRVESISKAVVFVGMKSLRNLVAVEALRDIFGCGSDSEEGAFSRRQLWLHSATVAILTDMVGKRIFGDAREDLFLAGIIHDVGLIAIDQVVGDKLRKACRLYQPGHNSLIECEEEVLGTDHCRVGYNLAKSWNMPSDVMKAIRFHHKSDKSIRPESITGILQLAEFIASKMGYSMLRGKVEPLPNHLVKHVKSMLDNYKIIVRDAPGEIAKAKSFYESEE